MVPGEISIGHMNFSLASETCTAYLSMYFELSHVLNNVSAPLHVRVNFRESYRVYLRTMLRYESKSWRESSPRVFWEHRICETSHYCSVLSSLAGPVQYKCCKLLPKTVSFLYNAIYLMILFWIVNIFFVLQNCRKICRKYEN